jgi:aconitate hydratase
MKLASFALSRKDPEYVGRAQAIGAFELERREALKTGKPSAGLLDFLGKRDFTTCGIGSAVFALKPGDGSAREQAASCQRVLGGVANITGDYATKRYRSNVINWGMLPFTLDDASSFGIESGDKIYVPSIRKALLNGDTDIPADLIQNGKTIKITLHLPGISKEERDVILAGCLINYYS